MSLVLKAEKVSKHFALHTQGNVVLPVFDGLDLSLHAGECVALTGPSGVGKSTFMRMVYGNYTCNEGSIGVRHRGDWVDIASASPRTILEVRRWTMGHVSQFLRVIPRVPCVDIVAEPLCARGVAAPQAREQAKAMLTRLRIPERLWTLSPMTFSGGEQQRINIARCFIVENPIILLDEPTASLDTDNRRTVVALIDEAKTRKAAVLGIFHDAETRGAVCSGEFDLGRRRALCDA